MLCIFVKYTNFANNNNRVPYDEFRKKAKESSLIDSSAETADGLPDERGRIANCKPISEEVSDSEQGALASGNGAFFYPSEYGGRLSHIV